MWGGVWMLNKEKNIGDWKPGELDGILAKLEIAIISLYTRIDKIKSNMSIAKFQDQSRYSDLVHRYEKLVRELVAIHQAADGTIVRMTREQRKYFLKTVPTFFQIFGWHGNIDENGNIKYDA
jgi:hypothetical protein